MEYTISIFAVFRSVDQHASGSRHLNKPEHAPADFEEIDDRFANSEIYQIYSLRFVAARAVEIQHGGRSYRMKNNVE